jgi:hypothetical protein
MANYGPSSAFLLIQGRNITSDTFQLSDGVESKTEQTNALGSSWEEHLPVGIGLTTLEASGGLYDNTQDRLMTALQSKGETRQLVAYGLEGATTGQNCTMLDGTYAVNWKRILERDGITKAHALHKITGEYKTGKILHGLTAETSSSGDTTTASVNHGSSSTGTATVDLHLTSATMGGWLGVVLKGLHSADNITFGTLVTFTSTTGITAERKESAAGVEQYTAMNWAFTASTSGAGSGSITPFVSISRG